MRIKDLPPEIVEKMLERQVEQGNPRSIEPFKANIAAGFSSGGFTWEDTPEGETFWLIILDDNDIDHFYTKYPKEKSIDELLADLDQKIEQMERRINERV